MVESDQEAATEFYEAALGHIVVTDQASAAGVGSVPTPVTEDSSDWHVYARLAGRVRIPATGGYEAGRLMQVDSRAMRKVDLGEDLVIVVESSAVSVGAIITNYMRILVKLH